MPRDSAAADRPASYLVGTAATFPLFFRDRTKPINQLPFSPSAKFPNQSRVAKVGLNSTRLQRLQNGTRPAPRQMIACPSRPADNRQTSGTESAPVVEGEEATSGVR